MNAEARALIDRFLRHLRTERRLSSLTSGSYHRDLLALSAALGLVALLLRLEIRRLALPAVPGNTSGITCWGSPGLRLPGEPPS